MYIAAAASQTNATEIIIEENLSLEETDSLDKTEEQLTSQLYFEWSTPEESVDISSGSEHINQLSKIKAFATEQADIIELYGITKSNINDFLDCGLLVFEMKSVKTNIGTQFFQNTELPHLEYALLTSIKSNTKLYLSIAPEDTWYFVETKDCVQVYITDVEFTQLHTNFEKEPTGNSTETELAKTELTEEKKTNYPEDVFVLPSSKEVNISQLDIQDNYHNKEIAIRIPGNYLEYYAEYPVLNPYSYVKDIQIAYESEHNCTIISFTTDFLCAYNYTVKDGYLSMTITKPEELYDKIIILDAGHGGTDPGALHGQVMEKNINYTIVCTYLKELFEKSDIKVYYTRETDTYISLSERAEFASEVGADLFISLHANTFTSATVNGTQIYYSSANNKKDSTGFCSSVLAKKLVNKICPAIGTKNRGYSDSNYYVVKHNSVPAVLIELGFMTNKSDFVKLTDAAYQKKAAQAIFEAVTEVYEEYLTKQ